MEEEIMVELIILVKSVSFGVIGIIKIFFRVLDNINWLELILVLFIIVIIYGFKYIIKKVLSILVVLFVVFGGVYLLKLNYCFIEEIFVGILLFNFEIFIEFSFVVLLFYIFIVLIFVFLGVIDLLFIFVVVDNMIKIKYNFN